MAKLLVRVKGGPGSGNWGHAGRPGKRGGSAPKSGGDIGVIATGKNELYRWSNLQEIHDMFLGKRTRSLDVTDRPEWYFAPPTLRISSSNSWVDRTYGRVILDKKKLEEAGWRKDEHLKAEGAWRNWGKDMPEDEDLIQAYMDSIKGFEVKQLHEGTDLDNLRDWFKYRLGREIPIVMQGPEWYELGEQWLREQGRTTRDIYG